MNYQLERYGESFIYTKEYRWFTDDNEAFGEHLVKIAKGEQQEFECYKETDLKNEKDEQNGQTKKSGDCDCGNTCGTGNCKHSCNGNFAETK